MKIGIDLGTTNSAASFINENGAPEIIPNSEGERTTPSVILFEGDKAIVGDIAKEASTVQVDETLLFVKRQIGSTSFKFPIPGTDRFIDAIEASAIILKKVIQDAEQSLGEKVTDIVITVPAYFDDARRIATIDAAKMVGVNVLKVINEPTSAALAYYHLHKETEEKNIAIYDLGGGTFDVTIVNIHNNDITVLATDGHHNLGGFDFDNEIFKYVAKQFEDETGIDIFDDEEATQELRESAEKCKKALTQMNKSFISVRSQGKSLRVEITKDKFNGLIEQHLTTTKRIMEETVEEAKLTWLDIDKILLVGGSTRTPAISEMIQAFTGITPSAELNPDEVVALGAAVQASLIDASSQEQPVTVRDVNSHSLGILIQDNHNPNKMMNSIIIPKNSEIPCDIKQEFYTTIDNQSSVMIQVTEGEDDDPDYITIIGDSTIILPENLLKGSPLGINMAYDKDGIVHVHATDLTSFTDLGEFKIERKSNLTQEEFEDKQQGLIALEVQ